MVYKEIESNFENFLEEMLNALPLKFYLNFPDMYKKREKGNQAIKQIYKYWCDFYLEFHLPRPLCGKEIIDFTKKIENLFSEVEETLKSEIYLRAVENYEKECIYDEEVKCWLPIGKENEE